MTANYKIPAKIATASVMALLTAMSADHWGNGWQRRFNAPEIPAPPPLMIASEGAEGLAGILFGDGTRQGWGFAQACGWHCIHARKSEGQNIEGLPDWICIRDEVLWVELKRQRDTLRPAQVDMAARLIAANASYHLVRPSDFTDFCGILIRGTRRD